MAIKIGGTTVITDNRAITGITSGVVVGIRSAGTLISAAATTLNFVGSGNTFAYNASTNTIDISISGSSGGGVGQKVTGDNDNLFTWIAAAATVTNNITFDTTNSGAVNSYIVTIIPNITVASGIAVTVGAGKTLVIDALQIGDI